MVDGCERKDTCRLYWIYANNNKLTNYQNNPRDPHDTEARYWTYFDEDVLSCRHDGYHCERSYDYPRSYSAIRCIAGVPTPPVGERCYDFSAGTITNYKKGEYPECGASVVIPDTIGGQKVTAI